MSTPESEGFDPAYPGSRIPAEVEKSIADAGGPRIDWYAGMLERAPRPLIVRPVPKEEAVPDATMEPVDVQRPVAHPDDED